MKCVFYWYEKLTYDLVLSHHTQSSTDKQVEQLVSSWHSFGGSSVVVLTPAERL